VAFFDVRNVPDVPRKTPDKRKTADRKLTSLGEGGERIEGTGKITLKAVHRRKFAELPSRERPRIV
jgi:hypothetical protein